MTIAEDIQHSSERSMKESYEYTPRDFIRSQKHVKSIH